MRSLTVSNPSDRFDIRPHLDLFYEARDLGCGLLWLRDGMAGYVSASVVGDAIEILKTYESMKERGRIAELPPAAYEITWDQVVNVRPA